MFHYATKHPEGEHVEEQVFPTAMHEHVGEELVNLEIGGHEEVQTEDVVEVGALFLENYIGHKSQHVYYQKVFCDGWYIAHIINRFNSKIGAQILKISVITH